MEFWLWPVFGVLLGVAGRWLATRSPRQADKLRWWEILPVTPEVDAQSMSLAMATLRKSRRKRGSVTVARVGYGSEAARVWLGVEGVASPETSARQIAEAGGARLGEPSTPPRPATWRGWYYSTVWQDPALPLGSLPLEPLDQSVAAFADHANRLLEENEMCVVTARPTGDQRAVQAAMLTTSEALSSSWCDLPAPDNIGLAPRPATFVPLAGLLAALYPIVLAASSWYTVNRVGLGIIVASSLAAVLAFEATICGLRRPKPVLSLFAGKGVPLPTKTVWDSLWSMSHKRKEIPPKELGSIPFSRMAGWVNGGERQAVEAVERVATELITTPDGAGIGLDLAGRECYLPDSDRPFKVFVLGDPGKGKTTLLLSLLAADAQTVQSGARKGIFWIETKGEGAKQAEQVMSQHGCVPTVFAADDLTGPMLDFVNWDDPDRAAQVLTGALRYAYDPSAIMEQSAQVLDTAFRAAVACPPEACQQLGYTGRPNIIELSYWMLGGDPEAGSMQRVEEAMGHIPEFAQVRRYTVHMNKRDQQYVLEPTRNKLQALLAAKGLWQSSGRPFAKLVDLIQHHQPVVLNLGPSSASSSYSKETAERCAAMLMYILWDAIKLHCNEWQSQGRSIAVYSDELADIAGFGDHHIEVIREMSDQGRSRGVQPVFATQHYSQLPPRTLDAVMSSGTRAYFALQNPELAQRASENLFEAYTPQEIASLPVGQCAIIISRDSRPQPAFTLLPHLML